MSANFLIDFKISDDEWLRTAELRTQPETEPIFDAFYGNICISNNQENLFAQQSFYMSVADLAVGLCDILVDGFPGESGEAKAIFKQSDDALEITFVCHQNRVEVSCNIISSKALTVDRAEFLEGAWTFLERFIHEIILRIPDGLDWRDLKRLRECSNPH